MAKSIQELIAAKQKEIAAKKGRQRAFKFPIGKTKIRILPSWRGDGEMQFWHDFGTHFIKDDKGETAAIYVCTDKTYNRDCEICKSIGLGIKNAHDDETIELLKEANAGQQYLMNALIRGDENSKEPVLLAVGIGVFSDICDIIEEYDDITDLENGIDLTVTREGSGRRDTKYTVIPAAKSAKVPKEVMTKVVNLDEYVAQEDDGNLHKAIAAVASSAGLLPSARPATPASAALVDKSASKSIADDLADDVLEAEISELDESEEEMMAAMSGELDTAATEESSDDELNDDDLDELLADLEV